jgi:hypothetical protein
MYLQNKKMQKCTGKREIDVKSQVQERPDYSGGTPEVAYKVHPDLFSWCFSVFICWCLGGESATQCPLYFSCLCSNQSMRSCNVSEKPPSSINS